MVHRTYHNTTAKFNGYFNAKEIIKEALTSFRSSYEEDYSAILPIYIYANKDNASTFYSPMDTAIKKSSVVIAKHSMPNPKFTKNKKDEYCKWIDDNWLLIGQAHFYKREFELANEKFRYIKAKYSHEPIIYESLLWTAITHMEMDDLTEAQKILDELREVKTNQSENKKLDKKAPEFLKRKEKSSKKRKRRKSSSKGRKRSPSNKDDELAVPHIDNKIFDDIEIAYADLLIRKKEYTEAKKTLIGAIDVCKNRKQKTRLMFILAQLYKLTGDAQQAAYYFDKVTKRASSYEMSFYAQIYSALAYQGENSGGIKAKLIKMAKDEKNVDYRDQIYYTLAEIEFKENNKPKAIEYLLLSIQSSTSNADQKGKSFLKLADTYFEEKNYHQAKLYYDSTLTVISTDFKDYEMIAEKGASLKELVDNIDIITVQDSLRKWADADPKKLDKYIDNLIQEAIDEEERMKELKEQNQLNLVASNQQQNQNQKTTGSSWYFYSQQARGFGFSEFKKTWGNRKLEDNWRRSNKSQMISAFDPESSDSGDSTAISKGSAKTKAFYLKDLPLTQEQKLASDTLIAEALYKIGVIYKEQLNELDLSIDQFYSMYNRFGERALALPGIYQLYRIYESTGNIAEAEKYKNIILQKHPLSEYAKIIINPNFKEEQELVKAKEEEEYEETYKNYLRYRFREVITKCDDIITNFPENKYLPKYHFLKVLTLGKMPDKDPNKIKEIIREVANKYPNHEVGIQAKEMMSYFDTGDVAANNALFSLDENLQHFFLLVFPSEKGSINKVKNKVSNFNSVYYSSKNLSITATFLDQDTQIIIVKSFDNKVNALDYFNTFKTDDKKLKGVNDTFKFFVITNKNYATLFAKNQLEEYLLFFKSNYQN